MTAQADHFYLPRAEQAKLDAILAAVPGLVDDLAVTLTRQDRFVTGPRIGRRKNESAMPFNPAASDAADALHTELVGWVRLVCEQRAMAYEGGAGTAALSAWLRRWMIALAMTEGAEEALPRIDGVVRECRRITDRPIEPPQPEPNAIQLAHIRGMLLNARGCAAAAREAGVVLTQRRVKHLAEVHAVTAVWTTVDGVRLFRLGDVLDAHLSLLEREHAAEIA